MRATDDAVLAVENLKISLNNHPVVDGLSFDVKKGERLCLLGPSGSGKSLTANAVLGLWGQPFRVSGSIRINGIEVGDLRVSQRPYSARVGMVFQDTHAALNPLVTVGAQLREPFMRFHGLSRPEAHEAAKELLARMMIDEPASVFDRSSAELSGGQRQRICLALALACKPPLIVADEPTTALDVLTQTEVLDLIKESTGRDETPALLFISHDINAAAQLCERAIIIQDGRLVESNALESLIANPAHRFSRELVASFKQNAPVFPGPEHRISASATC